MSGLSTSEFKSIVDSVAAEQRRIISVSTSGFAVTLMVLSGSGKQSWQAYCEFDPRTGDGPCYAAYPSSKELQWFAEEVARRIRARA
jgi:hypothetical protein